MPLSESASRPLSAPGRGRRVGSSAAVVSFVYLLGFFPPRVEPRALMLAGVLTGAIVAAAVTVPWHRLPPMAEASPALAYFVVVAVLREGSGSAGSSYTALVLLPMLWLALFHDRAMLVAGLAGLIGVFVTSWVVAGSADRLADWRRGVLLLTVGVVASLTLRHHTGRAQRHAAARTVTVAEQRKTQRLMADVLAAATEQAIIGVDPAGTIRVFNAGAERLTGYGAAEVVGTATPELLHVPGELQARADELGAPAGLAALVAGATIDAADTREWTYVRKDGGWIPVAVTVSVMHDEAGELTGHLCVARDVTGDRLVLDAISGAYERERAAANRLLELDQVRGDLVATVSHELRTPLTSILGSVEILTDGQAGEISPEQAKLLAAADRNARRLLALIEDLSMLSLVDSGVPRLDARPVPVRAVVDGAVEALQAARARYRVHLEVDLPDEPLLLYGDKRQLERVVTNLVDNALKFTPPGGRAAIGVEDVDGAIRLTVSDDGIGIPADEIDQVFDRFFRSSRARERQSQGAGLGLSVTKSIVDQHGGRISVASVPDGGTVVTCLLPGPPAAHRP